MHPDQNLHPLKAESVVSTFSGVDGCLYLAGVLIDQTDRGVVCVGVCLEYLPIVHVIA